MPDTPTPAELARVQAMIGQIIETGPRGKVRLTAQFFEDMRVIAAALSRLSQAEQERDDWRKRAEGDESCARDWKSLAERRAELLTEAIAQRDQVEQERDASDAVIAGHWGLHAEAGRPWRIEDQAQPVRAAIERHKRSRQQRGT